MARQKASMGWFFAVFFLLYTPAGHAAELRVGGRVSAAGKALAGAEVSLWPVLGRYEQARRSLAGVPSEPAVRRTTGADGRFELVAPAPGMWRVRVEAKGRPPVEIELTPLLDTVELPPAELEKSADFVPKLSDARQRSSAGWVWLAAPSAVPKPELPAGAARRVRIVDLLGAPLGGVIVFVAGEMQPLAQSDAAGEATLLLAREAVTLELLTATGATARHRLEPASGEAPPPAIVKLVPAPGLAGKVIDRTSRKPIAGAYVWMLDRAGDCARSDAAGSYALVGVVDPPRAIAAAAADFVSTLERVTVIENALPTLALRPAGSVAGRVLDRERRPVADVELTLTLQTAGGPPGMARYQPGGLVTTRTSARGEFLATEITAGASYRLDWRKPGFAPGKKDLEPLKPAEKRGGLELVLESGRKAVGRVTDTTDQPIAGASVRLVRKLEEGGFQARLMRRPMEQTDSRIEATTDSRGGFEAAGLAPGRYDLEAEAESFAPVTVPGIEIAAGEGEVDLGTVILAPGVAIEGRVLDPVGQPLAGAEIRTFDSGGLPFLPAMAILRSAQDPARARSDAAGWFRLSGLAPGVAVALVVTREGFIATAIGGIEPPQAAPVEVVLQPAARVSGRVLDGARRGVSGATVLVRAEARGLGGSSRPAFARSDAEGRFEVTGVEPGKVSVGAMAQGFQDLDLAGLEVPSGGVLEGLELVLTEGAVVEGTVVDAAGNPLIGVAVEVLDPRESGLGRRSPRAQTDGEGRYSITNASLGPRAVEAQLDGYDRAVRDVEIKAGVNRVDLVLGKGVEVAGRVIGGGGAPVAGATLRLEAADGFGFSGPEVTSRADGGFSFAGVVAGDYRLSAEKTGYATARAAQPLEVRSEPVLGLELVLETGASVRGAVRGLAFEELGRLVVRAFGEGRSAVGQIDYEGRYEVAHLSAGEWTIFAEVEGTGRQARESVTIEPGVAGVERDLVFGKGHSLSGVAVRRGGEPIGGTLVWLQGKTRGGSGRATTRHDGSFRIEGLESDVYELVLGGFGGALTHTEEVEVDGDTEVRIEIGTGRIRGRVREGEQGVSGARISVRAVDEASLAFAGRGVESDAAGNFDLGEVAAGRWRVVAEKAGYATAMAELELAEGAAIDDLELQLVASEGVRFSVAWAAGGVPSAVQVLVVGASGPLLNSSYTTGEGGRVWLSQVPAGTWRLLVQTGESAVAAREVVAPGDAGRIVLGPGGKLDLRVSELAESTVEAKLTLVGFDGQAFALLDWIATGKTEIPLAAGRASVSGLGPGSWTAVVTAADGRSWSGEVTIVPGVTTALSLE